MEATKDDRRQQLIKSLATIAKTKLTKVQQGQFNNFIAQAMHFYPDADYLDRTSENIFWNIWGLFCFTQKPFRRKTVDFESRYGSHRETTR